MSIPLQQLTKRHLAQAIVLLTHECGSPHESPWHLFRLTNCPTTTFKVNFAKMQPQPQTQIHTQHNVNTLYQTYQTLSTGTSQLQSRNAALEGFGDSDREGPRATSLKRDVRMGSPALAASHRRPKSATEIQTILNHARTSSTGSWKAALDSQYNNEIIQSFSFVR
ncbi:hypothetical protein BC832DRAFT_419250 [Gaertneriomyces semiglobifer]|nr:hypothetical protein BC832DRAFT_419250 [Gaertneriomyces semiglobifer]